MTLVALIRWVSFLALTITPALTIYGVFNVKWNTYTAVWSVLYYFVTGLGITAGYHVSFRYRYPVPKVPRVLIILCGLFCSDFGPTDRTPPRALSNTSSPAPELEPSRDPSSGGPEATELTTVTPTPRSTLTRPTRGSGGHTSVG